MDKGFRYELKYFITDHKRTILTQRLNSLLELDRNVDKDGSYLVKSIYFDDIFNSKFYDKIQGVDRRDKFRIRTYGEDSPIKLEKKIREGDRIKKRVLNLSKEDYDRIIRNRFDFHLIEGDHLWYEFYFEYRHKFLRPVVLVLYKRIPYIYKDVRITIDTDIMASPECDLFKDNPYCYSITNMSVLEIKFDNYLPSFIKDVINVSGLQQLSISKYAIARKLINEYKWEDEIL